MTEETLAYQGEAEGSEPYLVGMQIGASLFHRVLLLLEDQARLGRNSFSYTCTHRVRETTPFDHGVAYGLRNALLSEGLSAEVFVEAIPDYRESIHARDVSIYKMSILISW